MENKIYDNTIRELANEKLANEAAFLIARQNYEELLHAQGEAPERSQEEQEKFKNHLAGLLEKEFKQKHWKKRRKALGQIAASATIIVGISLTGAYFTVDAAKAAIDNFFLRHYEGYSMIDNQEIEEKSGILVPDGWSGPVMPTWIPARYVEVEGFEQRGMCNLFYYSKDDPGLLTISIFNSINTTGVNTEKNTENEEIIIQNVSATTYYVKDRNEYHLIMTKNGWSLHIAGNIDESEIIKIAENILF